MNQLLNELFKSSTSMVVYGDNQGALYLVKNRQVNQCMKHINIHQNFIGDLQRQKKVIGWFLQSKENMADGATKNLPEKLFMWHMEALKTGVNLISQREDVGDNGEAVSPMMSYPESTWW